MTYRRHTVRRRIGLRHAHRGHKLSAATRRKISAKERGRKQHHRKGAHPKHHKGHKLSAAARKKLSAREKGRKHPHRGVKGHHHRRPARRHATHHRTTHHPNRARRPSRHTTRTGVHRHGRITGRATGRARVRARRGRIYPSHFGTRRRALHSRFNHHKRVRSLRAPFVAGRRHVRAWK